MSSRPLSPHLQIYRPQLTSLLSITHRGTGVFLSAGALVIAYWLVSIAAGEAAYETAQVCLGSLPGKLLMALWTFSFYFHLCNGVRHLFWDIGAGFELKTLYASGYAVIVSSLTLTAITWGYALSSGGGQ
ncbi:MAG: succinate dehydrogenase / fumarate reductase cytochrome b subunit [Gammaproteobacteria bacterium]|jgi:succinate dehydrogenase / fumarate reductase cytochrome b subunit